MMLVLSTAGGVMRARAGEVYKWTDRSGEVHYSDTLPAGVKGELAPKGALSVVPSGIPPESAPVAQRPASKDSAENASYRALVERRQHMIEDCEQNNGIDCEREVDTELGAEALQLNGPVRQFRQVGPAMR
jgi:hypothetical protein